MRTRLWLLFLIFLTAGPAARAQSYAFGLKGGLTVGSQRWDNSFQRDPLFRYHGIAFVEALTEDNEFGLFAQAGYHVKGSAIRTFRQTFLATDGREVTVPARETPFEFRNISLTLGAKQNFSFSGRTSRLYYLLGVRGDYSVSTQLAPDDLPDDPFIQTYYLTFYPIEGFVNKFNYGVTLGSGIELPFSDLVGMVLEFTVNPDFSKQYNQPLIRNVINPNPNAINNTEIPERSISNVTFELTLGFRFLHIIEYID